MVKLQLEPYHFVLRILAEWYQMDINQFPHTQTQWSLLFCRECLCLNQRTIINVSSRNRVLWVLHQHVPIKSVSSPMPRD